MQSQQNEYLEKNVMLRISRKKLPKHGFPFFFAKNLDEERNLHYFCYLTPNFQTLDFIKLGLIFVDSYTNELKYKHKSILLRHFF